MTLEWKRIDTNRWQSGQHTIIWQHGQGYVHVHGARQRHGLTSLAAAQAWAESLEHPEFTILLVATADLLALTAQAVKRGLWFEVTPLEDKLWQIRFKKDDGFVTTPGEQR